jgi:hypothetical protein
MTKKTHKWHYSIEDAFEMRGAMIVQIPGMSEVWAERDDQTRNIPTEGRTMCVYVGTQSECEAYIARQDDMAGSRKG